MIKTNNFANLRLSLIGCAYFGTKREG